MGLFGSIAGLLGGGKAKKASRKAEAAQLAALQQALEVQRAQQQQTRADFEPFRQSGLDAIGNEADLLGLNGNDAAAASIEALKASPLFASLFDTGEEAILANASATGGLRGGNTQNSLADFGRDTLASVVENQLNRLRGVGDRGIGATGAVAQSGLATSGNIAQLLGQQGDVRASGLLTRAGITARQFSNIGSLADKAASFLPGIGDLGSLSRLKF